MRNRKITVGLAVVVLAALSGGGAYWFWGKTDHTAGQSVRRSKPVRVQVIKPQQGGVERTVMRPGTVHAFQYAQLFTKVSGFLQNQKVDIGSRVKQNELLAQIYAPELQADVRKAASDLTKARAMVKVMIAQLAAARASLHEAKAKLGQTEADVESAQAMVTLRREEYKRIHNLADQGAVDRELVDEKYQARQAAEASERSAKKAVATAKAAIVAATAKITQARANLDDSLAQVLVAKAVLRRAQIWQDYTQIRSPYTGVITQRGYHGGDFIRAATAGGSQPPVLTVTRTDLMRIVVWVPDPDVPYTHVGARATLRITSMPGRTFTGKVSRTADAEDPNTRAMRTEVDLPNPDNLLKEGMFGELTIALGKSKHGLTIPSNCLFGPEKENKRSLYVVRDGKALQVSVLVGQDDGIRAEILGGLTANDQVIEQHDPGLANGVPVRVVSGFAR